MQTYEYITIILLVFFVNKYVYVSAQQSDSIEVSKCTQYKKSVFDSQVNFQPLIHGARQIPVEVNNCKAYAPFVVGGSPAKPKEFPHMARLGYAEDNKQTIWFCGGTLISDKFVMTAAHCFYPLEGDVNLVRLGELDFSTTSDDARPEDYGVSRYIEHPNYEGNEAYNDIGLVELEKSVHFTEYILPACLPITNGDEFSKLIAVGWGSTGFAKESSDYLLKVGLKHFSFDICDRVARDADNDKFNNGFDNKSQLCAGSTKREDTCQGDSGGPLLSYHNEYDCMYFVVGITSTGFGGCGNPGTPALYTRVYNFMGWIKQHIWK